MWHQKLLKVHLTSYENLWKKSLLFTVSSFCSSRPCRLESLRLKMPFPDCDAEVQPSTYVMSLSQKEAHCTHQCLKQNASCRATSALGEFLATDLKPLGRGMPHLIVRQAQHTTMPLN